MRKLICMLLWAATLAAGAVSFDALAAPEIAFAQEETDPQSEETTGGTAQPADRTAARPPQGFFEIVFSGGPVGIGIMLCLIGLSLTAVYLMI